jgi:primosomal replication protein N
MKAILVGVNQALSWSEVPDPVIKSEEVLVEIHYAALNRADLMQRAGDYPPPPGCPEWMGLEISGVIVEMGEEAKAKSNYKIGDKVKITGQFRSYNNYTDVGNKLILTLFAKTIEKAEDERYLNEIILNGFLCKEPVYRTTPFGREITDIILAVNRPFGKSDYIPCIAWGRNAKFARNLSVGDNIEINGRIQSREYQKKISDTEVVTKTAYEVSVTAINICT